VLPRLAWLAPRRFVEGEGGALEPLDAAALFEAVLAREAPSLVAAVQRGEDGAWHETLRGFIVDDDWPARALAFAAPAR
jgi:uncharacterized protein